MSNEFFLSRMNKFLVIFMHDDETPHYWLGTSISKFDLFTLVIVVNQQIRWGRLIGAIHRMSQSV